MLVLALVAAAHLPVLLAPVIAAAATAAGTPYLPCASATTPRLVPDADLPGANAARSAVTGLGIIVGPALGGVLLLLGSPALAFLLNGLTFGLSAATVLAIPAGDCFRPAGGRARAAQRAAGGIAAGAAVLRAQPGGPAAGRRGHHVQRGLRHADRAALLVARRSGLGLHGYGYLFAASAWARWPAPRWPAGRCGTRIRGPCWPTCWPRSGCRCCCWPSSAGRSAA